MSELFNVLYPNKSTASLTVDEIVRQFKAGSLPADAVVQVNQESISLPDFVCTHSPASDSLPTPSLPKPTLPTPSLPKPTLPPPPAPSLPPTPSSQIKEQTTNQSDNSIQSSSSTRDLESETNEPSEPAISPEDRNWIKGLMLSAIPFFGFFKAIQLKFLADQNDIRAHDGSVREALGDLLWLSLGTHVLSYLSFLLILTLPKPEGALFSFLLPIKVGIILYIYGWVCLLVSKFGLETFCSHWQARRIATRIIGTYLVAFFLVDVCQTLLPDLTGVDTLLPLLINLCCFAAVAYFLLEEVKRAKIERPSIIRLFCCTFISVGAYALLSGIFL